MAARRSGEDSSLVPARAGGVVPFEGAAMRDWAEQLVDRARSEGLELTGDDGLLTAMVRQVLQTGLEVELADHLGYEPYDPAGRGSGNSRNGSYPKTVTTEIGEVDLRVPRDRNGTFEPVTVPKFERRLDGLSGNVISLYAKGMTTGDIQAHLFEIYDTDISRETISKITDAIVAEMVAWQNRPLDPIYPVVLIDAIVIKVRDSQVANRPVYVAIGVNLDGERDVLGMWLGPTGGEGAKQWATMLTDLRNLGIADVLIVCCDGLKGLPDAIRTTWPDTTVQTCVVHMVRNSLRYASKQDWSQITKAMRAIYTAPTVEAAETRFAGLRRDVAGSLPGDDRVVGERLGRVRAVPGRAPQDRLHHQRHREPQRPVPPRCPPPRALPQRTGRHESPLPDRNPETTEP
jgi:putative transposase